MVDITTEIGIIKPSSLFSFLVIVFVCIGNSLQKINLKWNPMEIYFGVYLTKLDKVKMYLFKYLKIICKILYKSGN